METILGFILIGLLVCAFAAAIVRPWLAFVLIVGFPVIEQAIQGYYPFFVTYRTLFNYLIAATVAVTLLVRFVRVPSMLQGALNPVSKLIIVLQILSFVSLLWTPGLEYGFEYTFGRLQYTLLFMVMAPLLISSLDDFRRLRMPMLIIGSLALLVIVLGPNARFYGTRLMLSLSSSEEGNPLIVAELGALLLIFGVLTTQRGVGKLVFPFQIFAGVFGFGMGLLSGSRGQVLAGALVSFLFFPVARKVKNTFGFLGLGVGIGFLGLMLYVGVQLFVSGENVARWSYYSLSSGVTGRFQIAMGAVEPWLDNPLSWMFGRGAGAFSTGEFSDKYPHNFPIEALTELGLVGFVVYALIIAFTVRALFALFRMYRNDPEMRSCVAVLGATATFSTLISLKQGTVHDPGAIMIWYLVIARIYWFEQRSLEYELEHEEENDQDFEEDFDEDDDEEYEHYHEHEDEDEHEDEHELGRDGLAPA